MGVLDMNDQDLIKNVYALYKKRSNIKYERVYVLTRCYNSLKRVMFCYTDIREVDIKKFKSDDMSNSVMIFPDDFELQFESNTIEEMISFCYEDYPEYLI